jgi:putative nucleotidyltransferase with HDIG domain
MYGCLKFFDTKKEAQMTIDSKILRKVSQYKPQKGLDVSARLFFYLSMLRHKLVKEHSQRVSLLAESVAKVLKKDKKAAFFAGLLHDIGKLLLPHELFDGHDITDAEYEIVKQHAYWGYKILEKLHLFVAVCCGLHHGLYRSGYGITMKNLPKNWSPTTAKKALEISTIVSICDFIDSATHRKTKIKDGSDRNGNNLREMLREKYPNDFLIIDAALEMNKKLGL